MVAERGNKIFFFPQRKGLLVVTFLVNRVKPDLSVQEGRLKLADLLESPR